MYYACLPALRRRKKEKPWMWIYTTKPSRMASIEPVSPPLSQLAASIGSRALIHSIPFPSIMNTNANDELEPLCMQGTKSAPEKRQRKKAGSEHLDGPSSLMQSAA
jgi:hypothetical protein